MGSRYDICILRDTDLARFAAAFEGEEVIGDVVAGPWQGPTQVAIAEIDTPRGSHVVVTALAEQAPLGLDARLADRLGAELLCATVRDSVSYYSLSVYAEGVDRSLSAAPDESLEIAVDDLDHDPFDDVLESALVVDAHGERLPEEPAWEVSEAYIQVVLTQRVGIDPGNLQLHPTIWRTFAPLLTPTSSPTPTPR